MGAVATVLDLLPVGARVMAPTDCYSGVHALLADGRHQRRWEVDLVDITDTAVALVAARRADLVWLESPTNPLLDIADLPALYPAAHDAGALVAVDNTFATPLLQQPLALGAHFAVHSATKFLGGHSDLLLGIAIADSPPLAERLRRRREVAGAVPGALETFLVFRGLRTLALRLEQGQSSASTLAHRLADHPTVTQVRYPGLAAHPGHAQATAQMNGVGRHDRLWGPKPRPQPTRCAARSDVIRSATSLGGVESTIERRGKLPGQEHLPPGFMRLSVGCEHVEDLWDDLRAPSNDPAPAVESAVAAVRPRRLRLAPSGVASLPRVRGCAGSTQPAAQCDRVSARSIARPLRRLVVSASGLSSFSDDQDLVL